MRRLLLSLVHGLTLAALAAAPPASAASFPVIEQGYPGVVVERIAGGLGVPWGMTFLDADRLLVTDRRGALQRIDLASGSRQAIDGLPPVAARGQGGLLDVAAEPGYRAGGWIYFTYSKAVDGSAVTTLARARLEGDRLTGWRDLLVTDSATSTGRHFGSRIAFDGKGHVFFGVGDRGVRDNGQDTGNHAGAILRLRLDGSVPDDNPFVGVSGSRDEIWSYGHRNPQGLFYDAESGRLWENEHGPRGGDEINLVLKGRNYGWPLISHGKEYWGPLSVGEGTSRPGYEDPRKVYIPSIAPGSLIRYRGDAFPGWRGSLFSGALALTHLNRVEVSANGEIGDEERILEDLGERIRAIAEGPDGLLYLTTDSGMLLRLRPD